MTMILSTYDGEEKHRIIHPGIKKVAFENSAFGKTSCHFDIDLPSGTGLKYLDLVSQLVKRISEIELDLDD